MSQPPNKISIGKARIKDKRLIKSASPLDASHCGAPVLYFIFISGRRKANRSFMRIILIVASFKALEATSMLDFGYLALQRLTSAVVIP